MLFLSTFVIFLGVASAQVLYPGQCDENVKPMENFDLNKFAGVWYEITWMEENPVFVGNCVKSTYTIENGSISYSVDLVADGVPTNFVGKAILDDDANGSAKLTAKDNGPGGAMKYWILSTDYTNYYLAYGCVNKDDNKKMISTWIYSRTPALNAQSTEAINEKIKLIDGIDWDKYTYTQHSKSACMVK